MIEDSVNEMIEDLERINECRMEIEAIRTRLHETEKLLKRLQQIELGLRVKLNKLWVSAYQKCIGDEKLDEYFTNNFIKKHKEK